MSHTKIIRRFPAGTVTLPPSKSLSHRAVICAALAAANGGESTLHNVGRSQDIDATTACMEKLCAQFARRGNTLIATPQTPGQPAHNTLDCAESGSTLRFLIPLAAMTGRPWRFTGRGRLLQRPLDVYAGIFAKSGAHFTQSAEGVQVQGPLAAGTYHLPGDVSSQFLSGLLLALPLAQQDSALLLTSPLESAAYVDLTVAVMAAFGVTVTQNSAGGYHIPGKQQYRAATYTVEGDYSQAAFFFGAGALGRPVACAGLAPKSLQGDAAILGVLADMGATITWENGLVRATASGLAATTIDAREIPDLVPPLAALCSLAKGTSRIINAGRLRLKESDRLTAMARELSTLGANIREDGDSLVITGKPALPGGVVDAHNDHRIAMAMALAAIGCTKNVALTGWESVQKSYPDFWTDFEKEALHG